MLQGRSSLEALLFQCCRGVRQPFEKFRPTWIIYDSPALQCRTHGTIPWIWILLLHSNNYCLDSTGRFQNVHCHTSLSRIAVLGKVRLYWKQCWHLYISGKTVDYDLLVPQKVLTGFIWMCWKLLLSTPIVQCYVNRKRLSRCYSWCNGMLVCLFFHLLMALDVVFWLRMVIV